MNKMGQMLKKYKQNQSGMVLASILMVTLFLSVLAFAIINFSTVNLSRSRGRVLNLQAQYAGESGADAALAILNSGNSTYTGTSSDIEVVDNPPFYRATYSVSVTPGNSGKEKFITATGKVYQPSTATTPKFIHRIEVYSERSSTFVASAMTSRNILYVESGVKNIQTTNLYINGFIQMNKNTTNLIAENIFVADKNTGASNCSIGGTGNLVKPSLFSDPAQTKTNITVAYNNCINPPGNNDSSDFEVTANTPLNKIQSAYIPWSQYMDNSYQDSPGGCADWTTGSFPRSIPSSGNSKKTHYPNSNSGVDSSGTCGSGGSLSLGTGQYNILDHAHIRANLCSAAACSPTFYNPDNGLGGTTEITKYIFVEGTIKFDKVNTAANSGPIVFITYGADPSGLSGCPYGGSIFVGNGSSTNAPAIFFNATNSICLSKTKFSSTNSLGGLLGKNIYIDSSPGTPFDLGLDPNFPVDQIPVDLTWKSVRYKRL